MDEKEDKVARTIEKYLKHRFSEEKAQQQKQQVQEQQKKQQESQRPSTQPLAEQQPVPSTSKTATATHIFRSPGIPRPHAVEVCPEFKTAFSSNTSLSSNSDLTNRPLPHPSIHLMPPPSGVPSNAPPRLAFFMLNTRPCSVSVRDDLKYVAMGFENSHISLWSLRQNASSMTVGKRKTLLAHSGPVYSIQFLKNDLMLSSSEDTTIRLWCLNTHENLNIYRGHMFPVWCLELSPLGGMFASGSMDATSRLWAFDKMTPIRILSGHDEDVECVKFHPNEKYVVTGSTDKTIRMWNIADGKMVRVMVGHRDSITSLSFLPNGKFLASASCDGCIKIWNLTTNLVSDEIIVPACKSLAFNLDQKFISSCGIDNFLRVWRINDSNVIERIIADLKAKDEMSFFDSRFSQSLKMLFVFGFSSSK